MDEPLELTIGEVARRAGVAASAVRFYESIELLPEPERLHGQRRYSTEVLGKLAFVDVAQNAGFKLEEIKELMRGAVGGDGMAVPLRQLSARKLDEVEAAAGRREGGVAPLAPDPVRCLLDGGVAPEGRKAGRLHPQDAAGRGGSGVSRQALRRGLLVFTCHLLQDAGILGPAAKPPPPA